MAEIGILIAAVALVIVVVFFRAQTARGNARWESYRRRVQQRRQRRRPAEEPANPDFQFDRPPGRDDPRPAE